MKLLLSFLFLFSFNLTAQELNEIDDDGQIGTFDVLMEDDLRRGSEIEQERQEEREEEDVKKNEETESKQQESDESLSL